MKAKNDEFTPQEKQIYKQASFIIVFFMGWLMGFAGIGGQAQDDPYSERLWMYIPNTPQGLGWACISEMPYHDVAQQSEAELIELVNQLGNVSLRGYLVEVASCNVDVLMDDPGGYAFAWRFTQQGHDGHPDHRHMTRGAAWIQWLSIDYSAP